MKRAHIFIHGDVTGVGFRAWTLREAQGRRLTGWVRNTDIHTVEAVFEGKKEKVEEMIKQCKKGPDVSWVEKIDIIWEEPTGEYKGFQIRPAS